MQLNKFLLGTTPFALSVMLTVTTSNHVLASDSDESEPRNQADAMRRQALSGLTIEELQRKVEEEEKKLEEAKKLELVRKINKLRCERDEIENNLAGSVPQAIESVTEAISQTILSSAVAPAIDEEAERQRFVEQAILKYEVALGEKIGQQIQSHFSYYAQPSMRQSLGLAYEGFVITLPLIAKYCTGQLPWRDQGKEWYEVLIAHACENVSQVKHRKANGLYNGQRPQKKQDHFDSLQLVKDCWNSTQGFHAAGIQRYALSLNADTLIGKTREEYVEAEVEALRSASLVPVSSSSVTQPVPLMATEAPSVPASSAIGGVVIQTEGNSIEFVINRADVDRLEKNVQNESKKLVKKVKKLL